MSVLDFARLAALRLLEPERAHRATLGALKFGWVSAADGGDDAVLGCELFGRQLANPIGLAAGFDKNGEVPDAMLDLGFGFVEIGTVTPHGQAGNPKPRVFRLHADAAVINRLGFNNDGLDALVERLARRRGHTGMLGINLGANKDSTDRIGDYVLGLRRVAPFADYVAVNVSSPNTPDLRALQGRAELDQLLRRLVQARAEIGSKVPLVLKIAPDLTQGDAEAVAEVALDHAIEGLIVSNTTVARPPDLVSPLAAEAGGLSGRPLFALSTAMLGRMYQLTGGRITLIGTGGIANGHDAYAKIRAGASAVQLYTALIYQGPRLISRIKAELAARLKTHGMANVRAAVGADAR